MSRRPPSIADIVQVNKSSDVLSKPKFISKKERQRLAESKKAQDKPKQPATKKKRVYSQIVETAPLEKKVSKKTKKFNFDWNEEDDTSQGYQPLIEKVDNPTEIEIQGARWTEKSLDDMTSRDWRVMKDEYNIISKGGEIPNPLRSWEEANFPSRLLKLVIDTYSEPTPIQRATIPLAISHRDVVGIAETGSGKTLAFLLPLLSYLLGVDSNYLHYEHKQDFNKPLALIVAPTRELALQIAKEAMKFAERLGFNVVSIIGGHQYEETITSVQDGVHIVVATPGRLIDSIERGIIGLDKCYYFTMDEADKMIDMGFEKSLQAILSYLPNETQLNNTIDSRIFNISKRVTLMFTATMSPPIEKITKNYLVKPGYLFIGNANEAVDNIDQQFEFVPELKSQSDNTRIDKLINLLKSHAYENRFFSVIVFSNFKQTCETLSQELEKNNFSTTVIHGSKSQTAREKAITDFSSGECNVLIATDVAARGIDIPDVSLVINYQMSKKFDEYIHRIGRTGRAGRQGKSLTFIDESDTNVFLDLKKFLIKGGKKCPDWLSKHASTNIQHLRD